MTRRMFRYVVPVDEQPHEFLLTGSPRHVAAVLTAVEFWAESNDNIAPDRRLFRVFGTGQPLPDRARWIGTCDRTIHGLVWHLYEVTP